MITLKKYFSSFAYAISGISYAFRSQFNMRVHIVAALMVIAASFILRISPVEWCVVLLCIGSVIAAELINTSLEVSIDLISPQRNKKAGQAKDLAAAGVFIVSIVSSIIGLIVFVPKIIHLLRT